MPSRSEVGRKRKKKIPRITMSRSELGKIGKPDVQEKHPSYDFRKQSLLSIYSTRPACHRRAHAGGPPRVAFFGRAERKGRKPLTVTTKPSPTFLVAWWWALWSKHTFNSSIKGSHQMSGQGAEFQGQLGPIYRGPLRASWVVGARGKDWYRWA